MKMPLVAVLVNEPLVSTCFLLLIPNVLQEGTALMLVQSLVLSTSREFNLQPIGKDGKRDVEAAMGMAN